jgi:hypothetical protein
MTFGPWAENISETERRARLRSLRALAHVFAHGHRNLLTALRMAETDASWLETAFVELKRLPSRCRRNIIATYGLLSRGF